MSVPLVRIESEHESLLETAALRQNFEIFKLFIDQRLAGMSPSASASRGNTAGRGRYPRHCSYFASVH